MKTRDRANAIDELTNVTQWNSRSTADSVLALGDYFNALLYFDEVHIPRAVISEEFADVCMGLASEFSKPPFDEPRIVSKVGDGIFLLGDGVISAYKGVLNYFGEEGGRSFEKEILSGLDEIPDLRERKVVKSMVISQCAVQAGVSGAHSCMHPDFLRQEVAKGATSDTSPIMQLSNISAVDVSQLTLADVLEIRRDPDFRHSLRKLRNFLREEFDGLSAAQIEDNFLTHLENHERAVARASSDRVFESISCFLGTSFWPSTLVLAATLLGSAVPDVKKLVAAGGVVAISAGRALLEFRKSNIAYLELREEPIDYVFKLRDMAEND